MLERAPGGRFFPGEHHRAHFQVRDGARTIDLIMDSADGSADVQLRVQMTDRLPAASCFESLEAASAFFAAGSVGYSATRDVARFDGLELRTERWCIEPLDVQVVVSRYFEDAARFPPGSGWPSTARSCATSLTSGTPFRRRPAHCQPAADTCATPRDSAACEALHTLADILGKQPSRRRRSNAPRRCAGPLVSAPVETSAISVRVHRREDLT